MGSLRPLTSVHYTLTKEAGVLGFSYGIMLIIGINPLRYRDDPSRAPAAALNQLQKGGSE